MKFKNREDAARKLARKLTKYKKDAYVLGLARGGIPIASVISSKLSIPFSVLIVRKIGSPTNNEFGLGALSENNVEMYDSKMLQFLNIKKSDLKDIVASEKKELKRRVELYRKGKELPSLKKKNIILVDDGMATGITMKAAIETVKKENPKKIIIAVPVCSREAKEEIAKRIEILICLECPETFASVGQFYEEFPQLSDNEIVQYF